MPVIDEALKQAGVTLADMDGIAVTKGPGLVGSLLVGIAAAKALALASRRAARRRQPHRRAHLREFLVPSRSWSRRWSA